MYWKITLQKSDFAFKLWLNSNIFKDKIMKLTMDKMMAYIQNRLQRLCPVISITGVLQLVMCQSAYLQCKK